MKHFTTSEAQAALVHVRPIAERMVHHRRRLGELQRRLEEVRHAVSGNGGRLDASGVEALETATRDEAEAVAGCVSAIEELGAQVKDLELGLVDFPAVHPSTGETVLLCWRAGEKSIGFWHGTEEGFTGRKPLPL